MYPMLRDKLSGLHDATIDFARRLIATRSLSLQEAKAAELVESTLRELGYHKAFRDEFGNVIGLLAPVQPGPNLVLNCHLDTISPVTETAAEGSGLLENGRLYGLGAADCKGGLAAQVFAGALLKHCLLPFKGNLILAASTAEKNGLSLGLRGLIETTLPDLGLKPDFVILGEPTNLGLYYGHDGWVELDVRLQSLNPFSVDDATNAIISDFGGYRQPCRMPVSQREMFNLSAPSFTTRHENRSVSLRLARRMELADELATVVEEVKDNLTQLVGRAAGEVAVEVAVRAARHRLYTGKAQMVRHVCKAWAIDPFHPMLDRARQALEAAGCPVKLAKWQLGRLGMGTAGSVLVNEFNIPAIGYGPGLETQAHAPGEWVASDNIIAAVYGTAAIAHSLVGIPVCGWTSDDI